MGSLFFKRRPVHLTYFVTARCNARCGFCFYGSDKNAQNKDAELSVPEIEKISASMGSLMWLAFSGGEVFMRDDLPEIAEAFYRNNRPAIILLPTNGILTERIKDQVEEILRTCSKSTVVVKLSLDGPEDIHDELRGVRGAYKRVIDTCKALEGYLDRYDNFELGVNTVFCPENRDYLDDLGETVRNMKGVRAHTFTALRCRDGAAGPGHDYAESYRSIEGIIGLPVGDRGTGRYGFKGAVLKSAQDRVQHRLIHRTMAEGRRVTNCYAGRINMVLSEKGEVYPCESFRNSMGNIREAGYDMERLMSSRRARTSVDSIRKGSCFCTNECFMMTNILFNPYMLPAVLREYVLLRFRSVMERAVGGLSAHGQHVIDVCPDRDSA